MLLIVVMNIIGGIVNEADITDRCDDHYSLLLELQGDDVQAVEAYETALSTLTSTVDVSRVWSR